ncbi:MAG TPA: ferritin-like domain-containing protein [Solirubrobacteraceae bacterium]|nr:ferritin-like domain-containing protein [Solirubrobacteraceae bacterium]
MDDFNLEGIDIGAVDVDGAIREGAEEVAGDTRLSFLRKGAIAGGAAVSGGAILSALIPGVALAEGRPPAKFGKGDIGILNFALTLEYLERAFYNEATDKGAVTDPKTARFLKVTTHDERKHVDFLKKALGHAAVKEPKFNFHGTTADQATFQKTAYVLENTGVHAYLGQAPNIKDAKILLAAASIVTIEARHSGAIGSIVNKAINPNGAFDNGLPASAILKAVTGTHFIA